MLGICLVESWIGLTSTPQRPSPLGARPSFTQQNLSDPFPCHLCWKQSTQQGGRRRPRPREPAGLGKQAPPCAWHSTRAGLRAQGLRPHQRGSRPREVTCGVSSRVKPALLHLFLVSLSPGPQTDSFPPELSPWPTLSPTQAELAPQQPGQALKKIPSP